MSTCNIVVWDVLFDNLLDKCFLADINAVIRVLINFHAQEPLEWSDVLCSESRKERGFESLKQFTATMCHNDVVDVNSDDDNFVTAPERK